MIAKLLLTLIATFGLGHTSQAAPPPMRSHPIVAPPATCATPAPTTPEGYQTLFKTAPAADIGISIPMGYKSIWLWGDDLQHGTRSSATVQDRGCLKTSGQLFTSDLGNDHLSWYWIRDYQVLSSTTFALRAEQMVTASGGLPTSAWDFKRTGFDRTLTFRLNADNTLTRIATGGLIATPPPPQATFDTCPGTPQPGQFCYSQHLHPELHLASGRTLRTTAQNRNQWTANWDDYRIIFDSI